MKFQTHPHKSDTLWLSKEDIDHILNGAILRAGALDIRLEVPDVIRYVWASPQSGSETPEVEYGTSANIKLTFDGNTGKLKSTEVL